MTQDRPVIFEGWPDDHKVRATQSRERFRHNLARIMAERGITQAGLARMMDVSRVAVHAWIWGTCFPETSRLLKLAQSLNVQIGTLLEDEASVEDPGVAIQEAALLAAFRKMPGTARISLLAEMSRRTPEITDRIEGLSELNGAE